MKKSCCYQCQKRHIGCQSGCPDRAAEIKRNQEEKIARQEAERIERDIDVSKQAFRRRARHAADHG